MIYESILIREDQYIKLELYNKYKNMTTNVFKVSSTKENVVYPPNQVFMKSDFQYMVTKGGGLIDDVGYLKLMDYLRKLGEKEFYILENMGANVADREIPFYSKISVSSTLPDFNNIINQFDPIFGLIPYHFFIYGQNDSWGIYLCECPTMNIIGCKEYLVQDFSVIFSIRGNGFDDQKDFISLEYQNNPELIHTLIKNYNL